MVRRDIKYLESLAEEIRTSAFKTILNANSGHLGACSSSTELMTALYFGNVLKYDPENPKNISRDRVYVRGHVGPLRYKIFSLLDWINETELSGYRSLGSRLKGHECMQEVPGVDMTPSGSLGMLLSYAAGSAMVTLKQGLPSRHFVFLGDGEEQEGNVSEAARHIGALKLPNITCIIDQNGKQLSRPTTEVDKSSLNKIWKGYGWEVINIKDAHDFNQIFRAYDKAMSTNVPTVILARTEKGHQIPGAKDHFNGYHTIGALEDISTLQHAIDSKKQVADKKKLETILEGYKQEAKLRDAELPDKNQTYEVQIQTNPSNAVNMDSAQGEYFARLMSLVEHQKIPLFFMTPDLIYKKDVENLGLERATYIDTGLREQHTIAMAHGISQTNPNARIFINYFDAFLYRASDQLNAAAQGKSRFLLLSELSGITQGKNGKTHQSAGVSAIPIFMPGVDFYEPADVQDMYNIFNHFFSHNPGLTVVRTHKANSPLLERQTEDLRNIDFYPVFESSGGKPDITLIGSGFLVSKLVAAAKEMESRGSLKTRVINAINLKRLNDKKFLDLIENDRPVLTVYNGQEQILRSIVSSAILESNIVRPTKIFGHGFNFGETGSVEDLIKHYSFDPESLVQLAERVAGKHGNNI